MEFARQEYWSGLPFPSPGDRLNPGIEPRSPALQTDVLPSEPPGKSKTDNQQSHTASTGNYTQYFIITYMGKEHIQLNHSAVYLKLMQHYKINHTST